MNDLRGTKFRFPLGFEAAGLVFSEEIQAQGSFYLATWLCFFVIFSCGFRVHADSVVFNAFGGFWHAAFISLSPPAYP